MKQITLSSSQLKKAVVRVWKVISKNSPYPENMYLCALHIRTNLFYVVCYGCDNSVRALYEAIDNFRALLVEGSECLVCSVDHKEEVDFRVDQFFVPSSWVDNSQR